MVKNVVVGTFIALFSKISNCSSTLVCIYKRDATKLENGDVPREIAVELGKLKLRINTLDNVLYTSVS